MIRAKGLQTLLGIGVYSEWGPISLQLRPEFIYAQNPEYDGFPDSHFDVIWNRRYTWWNRIDLPERYGEDTYTKLLPGQSSLRANYKAFSIGASTENIWWGPGRHHSLIMTNNAEGFAHISINTRYPAKTAIGSFEGQIVGGRLNGSGFLPPAPDRLDRGNTLYIPKPDDWRYINGITMTYHPKWVEGLYLGFNRVVYQYSEGAIERKDFLPIFTDFFRGDNPGEDDRLNRDQLLSVFMRWAWKPAKAEIYLEYGRNDASWNSRDFLISPEHSRAYNAGFVKYIDLKREGDMLEISSEITQLSRSGTFLLRAEPIWYSHFQIAHGYTNNGEVLGSGIGPGSNIWSWDVAWTRGFKKLGFRFERVANENDFLYWAWRDSQDNRRFWVDYSVGGLVTWKFGKLLLDGRLQYVRSLNYQWELFQNPGEPYFIPGTDANNLSIDINLTYSF
jgi:hypothetical protein